MFFASLARWDAQLNGLVELERRCQDLTQEVQLPCGTQEVLLGMVSKRDMQKEAPKSIKRRFSSNSNSQRSKGHKKFWNSCKRSTGSQSVKAKGKERGSCKDCEDQGR